MLESGHALNLEVGRLGRFGSSTCINKTGETVAVYGPGGSGLDTALFALPAGSRTLSVGTAMDSMYPLIAASCWTA